MRTASRRRRETYFSTSRQAADAPAGGADRRAASGADLLRPRYRIANARSARRNEVLRAMLRQPGHQRRRSSTGASNAAQLRLKPGDAVLAHPRAVLLRLRPRPAHRRVRREHRSLGRPQGVHDDRPALPAGGRQVDQGHALLPHATRRRRSSRSIRDRRDRGDDRRDSRGKSKNQFNLAAQGAPAGRARRSSPSCSPPRSTQGIDPPRRPTSRRRSLPADTATTRALERPRPTTTATAGASRSRTRRSAPTTRCTRS